MPFLAKRTYSRTKTVAPHRLLLGFLVLFLFRFVCFFKKPVTSQFVRPRSDDLLADRAATENALYYSTFARAFRCQRWKKTTEKKKKKRRGKKQRGSVIIRGRHRRHSGIDATPLSPLSPRPRFTFPFFTQSTSSLGLGGGETPSQTPPACLSLSLSLSPSLSRSPSLHGEGEKKIHGALCCVHCRLMNFRLWHPFCHRYNLTSHCEEGYLFFSVREKKIKRCIAE